MDFRLSLEQRMLRDSAAAALANGAGRWGAVLAEAGMLAVLLGEDRGGLGLGLVEASLVAVEAGKALAAFPVAETLAALPVLAEVQPDAVSGVLAGEVILTASASGRLAIECGQLRGELAVPYADKATYIAAAVEGGRVAILPGGLPASGPSGRVDLTVPNTRLCINGPAASVAAADVGFEARLTILRLAEMAGVARLCFDLAVQYLKDRTQFGRPIGANQALKHLAAENFVRIESIRIALEFAAAAHDVAAAMPTDTDAATEAARSMEVLLAYAPAAARRTAEDAIQMHGGIGATWEFALNAYLRRILRLGAAVGSGEAQRLALAGRLLTGCDDASATFSAAAE